MRKISRGGCNVIRTCPTPPLLVIYSGGHCFMAEISAGTSVGVTFASFRLEVLEKLSLLPDRLIDSPRSIDDRDSAGRTLLNRTGDPCAPGCTVLFVRCVGSFCALGGVTQKVGSGTWDAFPTGSCDVGWCCCCEACPEEIKMERLRGRPCAAPEHPSEGGASLMAAACCCTRRASRRHCSARKADTPGEVIPGKEGVSASGVGIAIPLENARPSRLPRRGSSAVSPSGVSSGVCAALLVEAGEPSCRLRSWNTLLGDSCGTSLLRVKSYRRLMPVSANLCASRDIAFGCFGITRFSSTRRASSASLTLRLNSAGRVQR